YPKLANSLSFLLRFFLHKKTPNPPTTSSNLLTPMARSLSSSRAYLAAATSTSSSSISFRRLALRSNSNIPNTPAADPAAADEPSTDPLVRQFEDAVHRIIVRRAAPDWLPFLPGSSYWVPSARSSAGSFGIAHLIQNLANPMTHEEAFSVTTVRGWPSSNYFIKGMRS
ncbi:hypothetical protein LINPERPRIM_LOCUS26699, partial [Linum perenne]